MKESGAIIWLELPWQFYFPPPIPPIGSDASTITGHRSLEQKEQVDHDLASSGQYSSRTSPHVSARRKSIHQTNQRQNHQQPSHTADIRLKGWRIVPDEFDCKLPIDSEKQNVPIQPPLLLHPKYDEATHLSENNLQLPPPVKQKLWMHQLVFGIEMLSSFDRTILFPVLMSLLVSRSRMKQFAFEEMKRL